MARQSSLALGLLLLIGSVAWSSATEFTVGDTSGWTTSVNYSAWTSGKTFMVGDTLKFNYASGVHTVDEVSLSDYSSCSASNPLSSANSGTTTITLKTSGTHYYICGISSHCTGGMKLAVDVASTRSPSSPTTPSSPSPSNTPPSTTTASTPASGSMSIGSVRELAVIGLGGLLGFVLGVF